MLMVGSKCHQFPPARAKMLSQFLTALPGAM
jgi:hypothetical protein